MHLGHTLGVRFPSRVLSWAPVRLSPSSEPARRSRPRPLRLFLRALLALLSTQLTMTSHLSRAERLPIRSYGSNEGLAGDHVRFILQDSRGFLWLATHARGSRLHGQAVPQLRLPAGT